MPPPRRGLFFASPKINKAPSQGLFLFAVFHQQVLDVSFTLDAGLNNLVKGSLGLYLVHEHRAWVPGLVLPDWAYTLDYLGVVLIVPCQ